MADFFCERTQDNYKYTGVKFNSFKNILFSSRTIQIKSNKILNNFVNSIKR